MHFNGQVIWITGASSGIGAELAQQLAAQGARLILTARNEAALAAVQRVCLQRTTACMLLPADLLQAAALPALAARAIGAYGHIDIIIHSAGVTQRSLAADTDMDVYRRLMEINFFAAAALTRYLMPHFSARRSGHVVAISSMAGLMGFPLRTGYAAAKHAVQGFFETLQTEHEIKGLHITIVSPGRIHTPISLSALTGSGRVHGQMDEGQLRGIPVSLCAARIIRAMRLKKRQVLIARSEKLLWWLWWFARPLYYRIARKKGREARTK